MSDFNARFVWAGTTNAVGHAICRLQKTDDTPQDPIVKKADRDGNVTVPEAELSDGVWTVSAFDVFGAMHQPEIVTIKDKVPGDGKTIEYSLISTRYTVDQGTGKLVFGILIALLAALIVFRVWFSGEELEAQRASAALNLTAKAGVASSQVNTPENHDTLKGILADLRTMLSTDGVEGPVHDRLNDARTQLDRLDMLVLPANQRARLVLNEIAEDIAANRIDSELTHLKTAREDLAKPKADATESEALVKLTEELKSRSSDAAGKHRRMLETITSGEANVATLKLRFKEDLEALESTLPALAQAEIEDASRTLQQRFGGYATQVEIAFWALVGILVRLIMDIQRYLRRDRFYIRGIYQHVALLVCVPIFSVVFISLATMASLRAADGSLVLDFADPRIVAAASFLLALSPWALWERLLGISRGISGKPD